MPNVVTIIYTTFLKIIEISIKDTWKSKKKFTVSKCINISMDPPIFPSIELIVPLSQTLIYPPEYNKHILFLGNEVQLFWQNFNWKNVPFSNTLQGVMVCTYLAWKVKLTLTSNSNKSFSSWQVSHMLPLKQKACIIRLWTEILKKKEEK